MSKTEDSTYIRSGLKQKSQYVYIDGIWKCTLKRTLQFPNGTLEPVIKISRELNQKFKVVS